MTRPPGSYFNSRMHTHCGHRGRCCKCGAWTVPPSHPYRKANPQGRDDPPPAHES